MPYAGTSKRGIRTLETKGPSALRVSTPVNLDLALEGLVRKVLREQPKQEDIYSFAAEYFETLLEIRDKAERPNASANEICPGRTEIEENELIKLAMSFPKPAFLLPSSSTEPQEELGQVVDVDEINPVPLTAEEKETSDEQPPNEEKFEDLPEPTAADSEVNGESSGDILTNETVLDDSSVNDSEVPVPMENSEQLAENVENSDLIIDEQDNSDKAENQADSPNGNNDAGKESAGNSPGFIGEGSEKNEVLDGEESEEQSSVDGVKELENEEEATKETGDKDEKEDGAGDSVRNEEPEAVKQEDDEPEGTKEEMKTDGIDDSNNEATEDCKIGEKDSKNENLEVKENSSTACEVSDLLKENNEQLDVNEAFLAAEEGKEEKVTDISPSGAFIAAETGSPLEEGKIEDPERDIIREFIENERQFCTQGNSTASIEVAEVYEPPEKGLIPDEPKLEESQVGGGLEAVAVPLLNGRREIDAADENKPGDDSGIVGEVEESLESAKDLGSEQFSNESCGVSLSPVADVNDENKVAGEFGEVLTPGEKEDIASGAEAISEERNGADDQGESIELINKVDADMIERKAEEASEEKLESNQTETYDKNEEAESNNIEPGDGTDEVQGERRKRDLSEQLGDSAEETEQVSVEVAGETNRSEEADSTKEVSDAQPDGDPVIDDSEAKFSGDDKVELGVSSQIAEEENESKKKEIEDPTAEKIQVEPSEENNGDSDVKDDFQQPEVNDNETQSSLNGTTAENETAAVIDAEADAGKQIEVENTETKNSSIENENEEPKDEDEKHNITGEKKLELENVLQTEEETVITNYATAEKSEDSRVKEDQGESDVTTVENGSDALSSGADKAELAEVMQVAESAVEDIVQKVEISTTEATAEENAKLETANESSLPSSEERDEEHKSKDESVDAGRSRSSKDTESLDDENPFISAEVTTLVESEVSGADEESKDDDEDNKDDESDVIIPLNVTMGTIDEKDEGGMASHVAAIHAAIVIQKNFRKYLDRKHAADATKAETEDATTEVSKTMMDSTSTDSTLSSSATKIHNKRMDFAKSTLETTTSHSFSGCETRSSSKTKTPGMSPRQDAVDSEVWNTLEKELDTAASTIQNSYRDYRSRQRLRREDAVQITTTASEESCDSTQWSRLQGTGELHDTIVPEEKPE